MARRAEGAGRGSPSGQQAKAAAVRLWTADPCGPASDGEPGERAYFDDLVSKRHDYAPWMAGALDYRAAAGHRVLDVGSGQGIDVVRYALAGGVATGIDLTPRHVDIAKQHLAVRGLGGTIVEGDAENLPFESDSFDIASSNGVLHHTPDIAAALSEINRVLKPGGRFTVILYNRSSLHYWVHQVLTQGVLRGHLWAERGMAGVLSRNVEYTTTGERPLVRVYTPREVRRMLSDAGFHHVSTCVRHLKPRDTILTVPLARFPRALDWMSRRVGWYVVGKGTA